MGHAVLTNQFISGLRPELKSKLAGHQGSFDQLLARARFKEAKQVEFAAERERSVTVYYIALLVSRSPKGNHQNRAMLQ